jgi:hypothetical protein
VLACRLCSDGHASTDTGELIRQEAALAKTEMREVGSTLARDGAKIGVAAGLGLVGAMAHRRPTARCS